MKIYANLENEILDRLESEELWGNNGIDYLISISLFVLILFIIYVIKFIIIRRLKKWQKVAEDISRAEMVVNGIDQLISMPFVLILSIYLATRNLILDETVNMAIIFLALLIVGYTLLKFAFNLIDAGISYQIGRKTEERHILEFFRLVLRASVMVVIVLWILANLGMNITSIIAGFGILGLAVAFALQNVIADIFASITIYLDKPFQIGDGIKVGNDSGTVERIGIRSTQIRAYDGYMIIISNRELTSQRIYNMKRMEKRRHLFVFGVAVDTPVEKLKQIPNMIKEIIEKHEQVEFGRVHFTTIGDFDFKYEVLSHILTPDFSTYCDIRQQINLDILERFEQEGIVIPYPTQAVVVQK
ncbi:MAG: mechanosensitive ion channel family protein [Promethearchaeota archaeon]